MQLAILAAGFSAGEADQLRRSMAAWRRKGGLEHFRDRVIGGMLARGYLREFAERVFRQIEGFGEYGFPESHAASFALLVYVSCWIKCHHPDAFLAAMLNSQPLGFYSPSQLVQDARRHGVQVLPADVQISSAESTLESITMDHIPANEHAERRTSSDTHWAVRMGLNRIKGLSVQAIDAIAAGRRRAGPYASVEDLTLRTGIDRRDLQALAAAGALRALAGHRHQAVWQASGQQTMPPLLREARINEPAVTLAAPSEGEDLMADYASLGLTLGRHPMALVRPELARSGVRSAHDLIRWRHGQLARAAGLVTHRQRPATASGLLFVSMEDETGMINVIVRPEVLERNREAVLHATLMMVYGVWQRDNTIDPHAPGQVCHLMAQRIEDRTDLLREAVGALSATSRDFH